MGYKIKIRYHSTLGNKHTLKNFLMKSMNLNLMKTNQDFKSEESAKQYSLLKKTINKPIGKLIKECHETLEKYNTKHTVINSSL